jgi:radical SAM protein with 4Fe4S-binding SPASM domain
MGKGYTRINEDLIRAFGYKINYPVLGPHTANIDLSKFCNFQCLSCWTYSPLSIAEKNKKEFLDTDLFLRLLDDLVSMKIERIVLSGAGDPSTHPEFYKICRAISEKKIFYEINTNLSLIRPEELVAFKPNKLKVHISAASSKTYQLFHGIKSDKIFNDVLEKISFLNNRRVEIVLVFVLCRDNVHEFIEMINLAVKLQVECSGEVAIKFNPIIINEQTKILQLSENQISNILELIPLAQKITHDHMIGNNLKALEKYYQKKPEKNTNNFFIPCYTGWFYSLIKENGDVYGCCEKISILGNLRNNSFKQIWKQKKYNDFRSMTRTCNISKTLVSNKCKQCRHFDYNFPIHNSRLRSLSLLRMSYLLLKRRKRLF